jgi:hypothetical protein
MDVKDEDALDAKNLVTPNLGIYLRAKHLHPRHQQQCALETDVTPTCQYGVHVESAARPGRAEAVLVW